MITTQSELNHHLGFFYKTPLSLLEIPKCVLASVILTFLHIIFAKNRKAEEDKVERNTG